jgi:hypothetical protein
MTTSLRRPTALLGLVLVSAIGLAACGTAATSSASPSPSAAPAASTSPSVDPGMGSGGGTAGDPGSGVAVNPPIDPTPVDPAAGQPALVVPKPGQTNLHPVAPTTLQASVDGRHVLIKVTWYGGVEPCGILDSVKVERAANDITITPFEGSGPGDVMCVEMAVLKATIVDLGELDPGVYRISSPDSDAPPIEITVA